jgi:hypothetical protein
MHSLRPLGLQPPLHTGMGLGKRTQPSQSPVLKGSMWRSTSAVTVSPQASSICGKVSIASMLVMSARRGSSNALTCGGKIGHSFMSAT